VTPAECDMTERIQVDDVGVIFAFQFDEPFARLFHIAPGALHPFELPLAGDQTEAFDLRSLCELRGCGLTAEGGEDHLRAAAAESFGELHRESPNATDGGGGHENALNVVRHGGLVIFAV